MTNELEGKIWNIICDALQKQTDFCREVIKLDYQVEGEKQKEIISQTAQTTQAILELMKPMSRERLIEAIENYAVFSDVYDKNGDKIDRIKLISNFEKLADAILKEWEEDDETKNI